MRMLSNLSRALKEFSRSDASLRIGAAAALLAVVALAAPASAKEARVKHPQPLDSLLYPHEYGSGAAAAEAEPGRDRESKAVAPAAAHTDKKNTKAVSTKRTPGTASSDAKTNTVSTRKKKSAAVADTSERPIGTPGSPTTKGVRGTPGEKPIPGKKK